MRRPLIWWALLFITLTAVAGCAVARSSAPPANFSISAPETLLLWEKQEAVIIDVRTLPEYEESHIPGIRLIPLDQLVPRAAEIPKEGKVIIICRSGSRSSQAVVVLRDKGYANVYNATGGMLEWEGPLVKNF